MGFINNRNNQAWLHNDLFAAVYSFDEYLITYNRNEIRNREDMVLIAIHNPEEPMHAESKIKGFHDVLQMQFWDTEEGHHDDYPPLTWEQGKEIKDFIENHKDKQFLIHCSAGISRSAGVACAVECIVNYNGVNYDYKIGESAVRRHYRYSPNSTVYDRIVNNKLEWMNKFDEEFKGK